MTRPWQIWILFGAAMVLIVAVMLWGSMTILHLDSEAELARERAAIEEDVRLALWRLDSSVVPIMARENAYPFEAYRSFARASAQSVE
ncbi:MAG: sensor histidine kinase, partial [bacterium]|nr:sensor histidine kinase [bacterium]